MVQSQKQPVVRVRPWGKALGVIIGATLAVLAAAPTPAIAQDEGESGGQDQQISERSQDFGGGRGGRGRRGGRARGGGRFGGGFDPSQFIDNLDPDQADRLRQMMIGQRGGGSNADSRNIGRNTNGQNAGESPANANGQPEQPETPGLQRPTVPPRPSDPRELLIGLDERGRVPPFNFVGQPWPGVLQWLANLYGYSFDWIEMPSDYLNLTTQRSYSVDEVRNLINRHLLSRGFTTVVKNDVLSVYRISKVEPSLVPRVTEDELFDLRPYEFVKITFEVPRGMQIERAPDDIKKLLSPSARIFPLVSTRRVVVMDVATNLLSVSELLNEERTVGGVPREFILQYARAEKVIETLYVILGINPDQQPQQQDVRLQRERWRVIQELAQEGGDVQTFMNDQKPKVFLAHNARRNSVLANAPPEQMRIIELAIDYLDVPQGGELPASMFSGAGPADALGDPRGRHLEKYQLITMDPDRMLVTLEEVGGLSPWTELRADAASKTLFVRATAEDHGQIARLVDQLDGTGRQFQVIPLRSLPALAVADTIQQLMVGQEDEQPLAQALRNFGGGRGGRGGRNRGGRNNQPQQQTLDPTKGFRVTADVENNRLLLWANATELTEVKNLLAQLGEVPGQGDDRPYRVFEVDPKTTQQLLEQLRRTWVGDNPVIIHGLETGAPDASSQPNDSASGRQPPPDRGAAAQDRGISATVVDGAPLRVRTALLTRPLSAAGSEVRAHFVQSSGPSDVGQAPEPTAALMLATVAAETDVSPPLPASTPDRSSADSTPPVASSPPAAAITPPPTGVEGAAPVNVTVMPDGRIIVSSQDSAALERMEQLIQRLSPPQPRFRVFAIKNVSAASVWLNLNDYYQEELAGADTFNGPWWAAPPTDNQPGGLSAQRDLRILNDAATNSIVVSGASPTQLYEIQQLIDVFDRPTSVEAVAARRTAVIPLRYSQATVIATAVKDVYRELLSTRDREFQSRDPRQQGLSTGITRDTVIYYGTMDNGVSAKQTDPVKLGFDSALSIGVDEAANALVVSAQDELFDTVVDLIHDLDRQAAPTDEGFVIHQVSGVDASALQSALSTALGSPLSQMQTNNAGNQNGSRQNGRGQGGRRGGQQFQFGGGQFGARQFGGGQGGQAFGRGGQRGGGQGGGGGRGGGQGGGGRGGGRGGRGG